MRQLATKPFGPSPLQELSVSENDRIYHARRARAELDLAYEAQHAAAADAHFGLAALHLGGLKELDEICEGSRCSRAPRR